jgi:1,4-alpha-glucan branching enzyme
MRPCQLRVATLSWEYPPRIVGEIALYTQSLCQKLAGIGIETHVVTYNESLIGVEKEPSGIIVHRVGNPIKTHLNILTWALALSIEFERVCSDINYDTGPIDLLDCQEWISVPSCIELSKTFHIPYVMTFHSLEGQRMSNPTNPLSLTIQHFEQLGANSASVVIVQSKAMKEEVQRLFNLPNRKVLCIPQNTYFEKRITKIYSNLGTGKSELLDT